MAQYDITIDKGATFQLAVTWKSQAGAVMDLTGFTARMAIRHRITDATTVVDLTTANARIAITPATGRVDLTIDAATTAAVAVTSGVYDLEMVAPAGVVTRLLEGKVTFTPEVTR